MPAIDEFGGYSSRLRIPEVISTGACSPNAAKANSNGTQEYLAPKGKTDRSFAQSMAENCADDLA